MTGWLADHTVVAALVPLIVKLSLLADALVELRESSGRRGANGDAALRAAADARPDRLARSRDQRR